MPSRNAVTQKIGDFYESCMDEKAIDAKGADQRQYNSQRIAANLGLKGGDRRRSGGYD